MGTATAMTDCELMRIEKKAMMEALHREHTLSDMFTAYLLGRNIRYEADLVDQLFNSSEKRLARTLLLLAQFGKEGKPETVVPKISLDFAFAIWILDATRHGHRTVVREDVAIKRIESGIVNVGNKHAFAQVVEHNDACTPA
jgi:CRP-like cAMP-binding protein